MDYLENAKQAVRRECLGLPPDGGWKVRHLYVRTTASGWQRATAECTLELPSGDTVTVVFR